MDSGARAALVNLIAAEGQELISDPRRTEAFLKDVSPLTKAENNILVAAQYEGVPAELIQGGQVQVSGTLIPRLSSRLATNRALTPEAARWAVETWAMALGLEVSSVPSVPSAPELLNGPESTRTKANTRGKSVRNSPVSPHPADAMAGGGQPAIPNPKVAIPPIAPQSTIPSSLPPSNTPNSSQPTNSVGSSQPEPKNSKNKDRDYTVEPRGVFPALLGALGTSVALLFCLASLVTIGSELWDAGGGKRWFAALVYVLALGMWLVASEQVGKQLSKGWGWFVGLFGIIGFGIYDFKHTRGGRSSGGAPLNGTNIVMIMVMWTIVSFLIRFFALK